MLLVLVDNENCTKGVSSGRFLTIYCLGIPEALHPITSIELSMNIIEVLKSEELLPKVESAPRSIYITVETSKSTVIEHS